LLNKLITNDQNGFIKGRNIGDNIRLMFDVIDFYANSKKLSSAILSADLYKAFHYLKWSFIVTMMKHYGFGSKIIYWIRILYSKPKCRIINKKFLSLFFGLKKGKDKMILYYQQFLFYALNAWQ